MSNERLMTVLLAPLISEKSTTVAENYDQYVFKVASSANKDDVKRAVEMMFGVTVAKVQIANVKGKAKRFGMSKGRRSDWKKAYVKLKEGQEISLVEA